MNKVITKERQSNFELLRIISMILIIMHHFAVHSGFPQGGGTINDYIVRFFAIGGKLGVNIFVLISGYFLVDSNFKFKKLLKLIIQLLFYSIIITLIFLCCKKVSLSEQLVLKTLFPASSSAWWFATIYILLYCVSPYLNIMIKNCNKHMHLNLILFLLFVQIVIRIFFKIENLSVFGWFITLYLIAAYIKLYPNNIMLSSKLMAFIGIYSFIMIAVFYMFFKLDYWFLTSFINLICSVSTFCLFKNFNIPNNKIINTVAKTTFGIYLIHDNNFIRPFIWKELFRCSFHYQFKTFLIFAVITVCLVFIVCSIIDFVRDFLFSTTIKFTKFVTTKIAQKKQDTLCSPNK